MVSAIKYSFSALRTTLNSNVVNPIRDNVKQISARNAEAFKALTPLFSEIIASLQISVLNTVYMICFIVIIFVLMPWAFIPPAPPLVGVEENPGPDPTQIFDDLVESVVYDFAAASQAPLSQSCIDGLQAIRQLFIREQKKHMAIEERLRRHIFNYNLILHSKDSESEAESVLKTPRAKPTHNEKNQKKITRLYKEFISAPRSDTPDPPLVGIETNPGPVESSITSFDDEGIELLGFDIVGATSTLILATRVGERVFVGEHLHSGDFARTFVFVPRTVVHHVVYVSVKVRNDDGSYRFIMSATPSTFQTFNFAVMDVDATYYVGFSYPTHSFVLPLLFLMKDDFVELLRVYGHVGALEAWVRWRLRTIETNPGPFDQLLKFLKNKEKYEERLPKLTSKSLRRCRVSERQTREERLRDKKLRLRDKTSDERREMKRFVAQMKIWPEVSVGLSADTQDILADVISALDNLSNKVTTPMTVRIDAIQPIVDKLGAYQGAFLGDTGLWFAVWEVIRWSNYSNVSRFSLMSVVSYLWFQSLRNVDPVIDRVYRSMMAPATMGVIVLNMVATYTKKEDFAPQAGAADMLKTGLLNYVAYKMFERSATADNVLSRFLQASAQLPKIKEGIESTTGLIVHTLQLFIDFVTDKLGLGSVVLTSSGDDEVDKFLKDATSALDYLRKGAPINYENGMRLYKLDGTGKRLLQKHLRLKSDYTVRMLITQGLDTLKPAIARLERANISGNGPRREPLGILICGPTGVGKSTAIVPLVLKVAALTMPEDRLETFIRNHDDEMYNRVFENEFFDGAHNQWVFNFDDLGQTVDVAGNNKNPYMEAIRAINTANWPLHMAHLDDKGSVNFNHELVTATTNRKHFNDLCSIKEPEAFVRRWKIAYCCVPKPKFCVQGTSLGSIWDRRLDEKLVAEYANGGLTTDIYEFHRHNFLTGETDANNAVDFDQLVEIIVETYRRSVHKGDKMLQFHQSMKMAAVEQRKEQFSKQAGDAEDSEFSLELESDDVDEGLVASMSKRAQGLWTRVSDLVKGNAFLAVVTAAIPLVAGVVHLIRSAFEVQSASSGSARTKRPPQSQKLGKRRAHKVASSRKRNPLFSEQAVMTQGAFDTARKLINRCLYKVEVEGYASSGAYALFLKRRTCVMPAHYINYIEDKIDEGKLEPNAKIVFSRVGAPDTGFTVGFKELDLYVTQEGSEEDIVYMDLPGSVFCHPDITGFFAAEDSKFLLYPTDCALVMPKDGVTTIVVTKASPDKDFQYGDVFAERVFIYDIATKVGDCGLPLLCIDPYAGTTKILGIHTAGSGTRGLTSFISREDVDYATAEAPGVDNPLPEEDPTDFEMQAQFLPLYEAKQPRIPYHNKVVPSPLHGDWGESRYAPSLLHKDGDLDPWALARSKYSKHQKWSDPEMVGVATDIVFSNLIRSSKVPGRDGPWPPRLWTFEEACMGIDGVAHCESIPRKSSPGYPYNLQNPLGGKFAWFGKEGPFDFSNPKCKELRHRVGEVIDLARSGVRCEVVYVDYLKDERRKKEKVQQGKTRMISASPMDYTIACRMLFGDFVRWFMENRIGNGSAVGINPMGAEWTALATMLNKFPNVLAGDYSNYDGSASIAFMKSALSMINRWYDDGDSVAREVLFEHLINSHHLSDGVVYEWCGSMPSGHFLTTTVNTLSNLVLICYSALTLLESQVGRSLAIQRVTESYYGKVYAVAFGDDNAISVSDDWIEWFNQHSITEALAKVGYTYTDEEKTGVVVKSRVLKQIGFLKRGFVFEPRRKVYMAPLELGVVLEMPYWTKKDAPQGSLEETVHSAILELSLHPKEVFDEYAPKINSASLKKIGYSAPLLQFDACRTLKLSEEMYF